MVRDAEGWNLELTCKIVWTQKFYWTPKILGKSLGSKLTLSLAQLSPSLFGPWSSYLKMDLKNDFFDFFQPICFWKAETKLEMNLLEFLGSEVI